MNLINTASFLTAATYVALFLAIVGLWLGRRVWVAALAIATILGYLAQVLVGVAVVWIAAFAAICVAYDRARSRAPGKWRGVYMALAAAGLCVLAVLLGAHLLPGFHNFLVLDKVVLSSGAVPYTLYLNFDKTLVGLCIIGLCRHPLLTLAAEWSRALRRAAPLAVINVVVVALGALAVGYLTWQPKWTPLFWIWAPVNLFFVCSSEEAFFRGIVQRELTSALGGMRYGSGLAIVSSAALFGLAHFAGGLSYVVLAAAAGLGYGIVYHRTRSLEMSMLAHFALNTTHFLLFTYPASVG
jgi:membrane protease YdiL (CAAX protease family)